MCFPFFFSLYIPSFFVKHIIWRQFLQDITHRMNECIFYSTNRYLLYINTISEGSDLNGNFFLLAVSAIANVPVSQKKILSATFSIFDGPAVV
jgi:hypothetical protein